MQTLEQRSTNDAVFSRDACNPALMLPYHPSLLWRIFGFIHCNVNSWGLKRQPGGSLSSQDNCVFGYRQQNDLSLTWRGKCPQKAPRSADASAHTCILNNTLTKWVAPTNFVPLWELFFLSSSLRHMERVKQREKSITDRMCGDACISCDDAGERVGAKWRCCCVFFLFGFF